MPDVCTLPQSRGGHEFESHASWGYGLPAYHPWIMEKHSMGFPLIFILNILKKEEGRGTLLIICKQSHILPLSNSVTILCFIKYFTCQMFVLENHGN
jgi:hypothetical protein